MASDRTVCLKINSPDLSNFVPKSNPGVFHLRLISRICRLAQLEMAPWFGQTLCLVHFRPFELAVCVSLTKAALDWPPTSAYALIALQYPVGNCPFKVVSKRLFQVFSFLLTICRRRSRVGEQGGQSRLCQSSVGRTTWLLLMYFDRKSRFQFVVLAKWENTVGNTLRRKRDSRGTHWECTRVAFVRKEAATAIGQQTSFN